MGARAELWTGSENLAGKVKDWCRVLTATDMVLLSKVLNLGVSQLATDREAQIWKLWFLKQMQKVI